MMPHSDRLSMHASEARLPLSEAAAISKTLLFIPYSSCNQSRGCRVDIAMCGIYLIDWHAPQVLISYCWIRLLVAKATSSARLCMPGSQEYDLRIASITQELASSTESGCSRRGLLRCHQMQSRTG